MPRAQTPDGVDRRRLRRVAAVATSLSALIATSIVAGPATASEAALPCALGRTDAHHSEGVDSWNSAYPRPDRPLDAVMIYLSFPDARPSADPEELSRDYFPATSGFFDRASYGKFRLRPRVHRYWIRMPHPSASYGIQRDWDSRGAPRICATRSPPPIRPWTSAASTWSISSPTRTPRASTRTPPRSSTSTARCTPTTAICAGSSPSSSRPRRTAMSSPTRPGTSSTCRTSTTGRMDGKGDWDTYVGDWDLMGSQFGLAPDPFAWHKWKLGWISDNQVDCVDLTRPAVHSLRTLSAPKEPRAQRHTRLLVARTGPESAVAIEARGAMGNDRSMCAEGVLVYRVRSRAPSGTGPVQVLDGHPGTSACRGSSVYPPLADAPLGVGESMNDAEDGVRIQVEGRTTDGDWAVKVGRD